MSMKFILIQIKFDIEINNDELLENIWKHYKKNLRKKKLIIDGSAKPKLYIISYSYIRDYRM